VQMARRRTSCLRHDADVALDTAAIQADTGTEFTYLCVNTCCPPSTTVPTEQQKAGGNQDSKGHTMNAGSARLAGKVALITGASGGQGLAEARLFAQQGATVILSDVVTEPGARLAEEIRQTGGRASFLSLDVTKEADWARVVDAIMNEYGALHCLVNNAGIVSRLGIMDVPFDEWKKVQRINVDG